MVSYYKVLNLLILNGIQQFLAAVHAHTYVIIFFKILFINEQFDRWLLKEITGRKITTVTAHRRIDCPGFQMCMTKDLNFLYTEIADGGIQTNSSSQVNTPFLDPPDAKIAKDLTLKRQPKTLTLQERKTPHFHPYLLTQIQKDLGSTTSKASIRNQKLQIPLPHTSKTQTFSKLLISHHAFSQLFRYSHYYRSHPTNPPPRIKNSKLSPNPKCPLPKPKTHRLRTCNPEKQPKLAPKLTEPAEVLALTSVAVHQLFLHNTASAELDWTLKNEKKVVS